ncbi:MAG: glucose-6-phosphate dehydrogenase [Deltaproteobacteria bacterium]|nr:glucose-6-phosphate dehydrogenase [Deltaproteobacteria bacterium]
MTDPSTLLRAPAKDVPADPCVLVIFGASGDLTKRLLMPALYNLHCDGLLDPRTSIVGIAMDDLTSEVFRDRLSADIRKFSTRKQFDEGAWADLVRRIHYTPGKFNDAAAFERLGEVCAQVGADAGTGGNLLFYYAIPPSLFGLVSRMLDAAGLCKPGAAWRRVIVEKPFGHDLRSAVDLNTQLLAHWSEDQVFRIDHYTGKETVQNILAFRFSNGIFEPLWNKHHIDHIQITVAETVSVEGRGKYYESSGVLRDMIQNHMFQLLAYLCMEPPTSLKPDAVRNERFKVLDAVRVYKPHEVGTHTIRGQYGAGHKPDGTAVIAYRDEPEVADDSRTETFAAMKLYIDNWRWEGVPIYLRSGKSLWTRATEILVQFRKAPEVLFRDTPEVEEIEPNQLIFHIQPAQGVELRFQAKSPGPGLMLQPVNMRFDYGHTFEAQRSTGYEVLIYNCMTGDASLFSRSDLVEAAWRIAQPVLDAWNQGPPPDFPNYTTGTWGPRASFKFIESDGRKWLEVVDPTILGRVPLFVGTSPAFLHGLALCLKPVAKAKGDPVVTKGELGTEMYLVVRGKVQVQGPDGTVIKALAEGDFFGELSVLMAGPRTANVVATTDCDLYSLDGADFRRVLKIYPEFAQTIVQVARDRYKLVVATDAMLGRRP